MDAIKNFSQTRTSEENFRKTEVLAIKIEMLRCFAAVARSGNLADAAEALGRTPSAVSMMLKQFEAHLGAPLFESERKSRLTALGAFTLGEATRELDHFERSVAAIENFARAKSGFVRIAAVPSVAEAILPEVTRVFLRDTLQFVTIFLTMWMFLTPLFWAPAVMPPDVVDYLSFIEANPVYHLVQAWRGRGDLGR